MRPLIATTILIALAAGGYYVFRGPSFLPDIASQNPDSTFEMDSVFKSNKDTPEETVPSYTSPISIDLMRAQNYDFSTIKIEEELSNGSNYQRYIASYLSEGHKIYGLLTVPTQEAPEGGFPAIVFNHGYIPPSDYVTTEKYVSYVDSLARNGFVVFKIDMRGHGNSEGVPTGSYFSSAYTTDALSALKALQKLSFVNGDRIGMWGHSMAGNLVLRAMLVSNEVKAGVIWAGAVYSYSDFAKYRISDNSYSPNDPNRQRQTPESQENRENSEAVQMLRQDPDKLNFLDPFWQSISLTANINYLENPLQLHHSVNDNVVNIGYMRDLEAVLAASGKDYEAYEYAGGGHNIDSPYFETAMQRTVDFFKENL